MQKFKIGNRVVAVRTKSNTHHAGRRGTVVDEARWGRRTRYWVRFHDGTTAALPSNALRPDSGGD